MTLRKALQWFYSPEWVLAVITAALYGSIVRAFPVAGSSAFFLEKHLWLDGFPVWPYPVWGMLARGLGGLSPEHCVALMNGVAVVCGVIVVCLTYRLHAWTLRTLNPGKRPYIYALGAASAALYLAVSTPMVLLGTRAHPLGFGVAMLLIAIHLMLRYVTHRSRWALFAFAFLYGVGLVEYAGFTMVAMPVGLSTLWVMWNRQHLRPSILIPAGIAFLAGISILAAVVGQAMQSPVQIWMESVTVFGLLRAVFGAQLRQILSSMPDVGALLVFMISVPPYALCLFESFRYRSSLKRLPSLILYVVVTGVTLMVLFNAPGTPWPVLREGRFVILPYFFVAGSFGFAVLYWHGAFMRLWQKLSLPPHPIREVLVAILPATLVAAPLVTSRGILPERSRVLYEIAQDVVDATGPCQWLVTDGSLDTLVRLAAWQQQKPLFLLSIPRSSQTAYRTYVAAHFESVRLQGLAQLGLAPLLKEWISTDARISERLAFYGSGDAWLDTGKEPVPERLVYRAKPTETPDQAGDDGGGGGESIDASGKNFPDVLRRHEEFWAAHTTRLWDLEREAGSYAPVARMLRWRIARTANDLGVYLQTEGQDDLARTAYTSALTINEHNLSAEVNLRGLEGREEEALPPALVSVARWPLMRIVSSFGHIHKLATLWKIREQVGGVSQDLAGEVRAQILEAAELYTSGEVQQALDRTNTMIEEGDAPPHAWYLRGLFAAALEEEDIWTECWEYMLETDRTWPAFLIVQASRLLRQGMATDALDLYRVAVRINPYDPTIVKSVAQAFFHYGTQQAARPYLTLLLSLRPDDPWGNFALGTLQFGDGEAEQAESSLRVAVRGLQAPHAYNNLAWVLLSLGKAEEAESWATRALNLSPGFAPALDTLGVLEMRRGNFDQAQTHFNRVLQLRPGDWDARVHQAQLALARGNTEQARLLTMDLAADRQDGAVWQQQEFLELCRQTGVEIR